MWDKKPSDRYQRYVSHRVGMAEFKLGPNTIDEGPKRLQGYSDYIGFEDTITVRTPVLGAT